MNEDDDIVVECEMERPPETVWRAVSEPHLVAEWLGVPEAGAAEPGEASWRLVEATPYEHVRYQWIDEATDHPVSYVTIELAPAPAGRTWFRLTHSPTVARMAATAVNDNGPAMIARAA